MSDDQANDPGQQRIDTSRAPRTRGFTRAAFVEVLTDDGWQRVNMLWENGVVCWMVLMRITVDALPISVTYLEQVRTFMLPPHLRPEGRRVRFSRAFLIPRSIDPVDFYCHTERYPEIGPPDTSLHTPAHAFLNEVFARGLAVRIEFAQ